MIVGNAVAQSAKRIEILRAPDGWKNFTPVGNNVLFERCSEVATERDCLYYVYDISQHSTSNSEKTPEIPRDVMCHMQTLHH